jgi:adenine-specific DNA-methyltransferase
MHGIDDREQQRLALQARLDAGKSTVERNRMGQFATPTGLARDMLGYGCDLVDGPIRFLDPAFGTGAFYSALHAAAPASRIQRCLGFEIDPHYAEPALRLWQGSRLELRIQDFTRATPPAHAGDKANLLICNPPYVRHHHLSAEQKGRMQALVSARLGARPSGLSGLYCYFLWLADAWLAPGGVAGWLVPGEWMDVNYGALLKRYLSTQVSLIRVHRFEPHDIQFGDALVSSTIIWFKKRFPSPEDRIEFSRGGALLAPGQITHVSNQALRDTSKWSRPRATPREPGTGQQASGAPTLGRIVSIKRGIATGANQFFVLSPDEIDRYDIPRQFLCPILPGPRYLDRDEILAHGDGDPDIARKRYLISAALPESVIQSDHPRLWRYLQRGVEQGIPQRYLCRHRAPWYAQEHRPPAPLLCTYMGRHSDRGRPFRFILNWSAATAANVYLLLYPRPALARAMACEPTLLPRVWSALNRLPVDMLLQQGRVYGGGLYKLEPRELARLPLAALDLGLALPEDVIDDSASP